MLNNLGLKTSKNFLKFINKRNIKNFSSGAKVAPTQGENMSHRFHDIYIKELDKLQKTKYKSNI